MAVPSILKDNLSIPVIGSPLFIISNPDLVIAQCKAGVIGSFPALNARPEPVLEEWLDRRVGAGATSDIDSDDGHVGGVNGLHEVLLVLEKFNGLDVALEFRIRHLPEEYHGTLRRSRVEGTCHGVNVGLPEFHVQFCQVNAVRAEDLAHGLDRGGASGCVVLRVSALPGSGPSTVQGI